MLYLLEALLDSREAVAAVWIFGVIVVVVLSCFCIALLAALFHSDPKVRTSAKGIARMLLDALTKGSGR